MLLYSCSPWYPMQQLACHIRGVFKCLSSPCRYPALALQMEQQRHSQFQGPAWGWPVAEQDELSRDQHPFSRWAQHPLRGKGVDAAVGDTSVSSLSFQQL